MLSYRRIHITQKRARYFDKIKSEIFLHLKFQFKIPMTSSTNSNLHNSHHYIRSITYSDASEIMDGKSLQWLFKKMLARWRSEPIELSLQEHPPFTR